MNDTNRLFNDSTRVRESVAGESYCEALTSTTCRSCWLSLSEGTQKLVEQRSFLSPTSRILVSLDWRWNGPTLTTEGQSADDVKHSSGTDAPLALNLLAPRSATPLETELDCDVLLLPPIIGHENIDFIGVTNPLGDFIEANHVRPKTQKFRGHLAHRARSRNTPKSWGFAHSPLAPQNADRLKKLLNALGRS